MVLMLSWNRLDPRVNLLLIHHTSTGCRPPTAFENIYTNFGESCSHECMFHGTQAWDFIVCYELFCIFQSLTDTKHGIANIFENLFRIRPDIWNFLSLPYFGESVYHNWGLLPKTQGETYCCLRNYAISDRIERLCQKSKGKFACTALS
jgi:hypothetical protein